MSDKGHSKAGKARRIPIPPGVHLVDRLQLSVVDESEMQRTFVVEALRRGASEQQIFQTLANQLQRRAGGRKSISLWGGDDSRPQLWAPLWSDFDSPTDPSFAQREIRRLLTTESDAYYRRVTREYDGLPGEVRDAFGDPDNPKKSPLKHYFEMRPHYYNAGFDNPAEAFLKNIRAASFLGYPVGGGLHPKYIERLSRLEALLNKWQTGLADKIHAAIQSGVNKKGHAKSRIGGFVPRGIAHRQGQKRRGMALSNHAFGLAVDVNSPWNPHIKDAEVIKVLKEITGHDFGHEFVAKEKGIGELDRVAQTHLLAQDASRKLQAWLQKYLPIYEAAEGEVQGSPKKPAGKNVSFIPGLDTSAANPACQELDVVTSENMIKMQILRRYHGIEQLREWSRTGIQSIPLELAAAMAELGFRWGGTYKGTKDIMHFELEWEKVFQPDRRPCSLEELLPMAEIFTFGMESQAKMLDGC